MPTLRARVKEKLTGFTRFRGIVDIYDKDTGASMEVWAENFQGLTQAQKGVVYQAKQYMKARELTAESTVFEMEWEI